MRFKFLVLTVVFWSLFLLVLIKLKTSQTDKSRIDDKKHFEIVNKNVTFFDEQYENQRSQKYFGNDKRLPDNLKDLKDFIFLTNTEQYIQNWNNDNNIELVVVIQVHNRLNYLNKLITSLSSSPQINKTLLIFSHDVYDEDINFSIQAINFTKIMQIFYPFSVQVYPSEFPGPDPEDSNSPVKSEICENLKEKDTYGHLRNASIAQMKHHWWWKINFVFNRIRILKNYFGTVLLLEEDHYVAPDFIHCLKLMEKLAAESCADCWFFSLSYYDFPQKGQFDEVLIRASVENLGLAFNRSVWYEISKFSEFFCRYDDYNWDWTLRVIVNKLSVKPVSMNLVRPRVAHIGRCGIHTKSKVCDSSQVITDFNRSQDQLFPNALKIERRRFSYTFKNFGGWADSRDHALCMGMS